MDSLRGEMETQMGRQAERLVSVRKQVTIDFLLLQWCCKNEWMKFDLMKPHPRFARIDFKTFLDESVL
jgi:hypothetical protein